MRVLAFMFVVVFGLVVSAGVRPRVVCPLCERRRAVETERRHYEDPGYTSFRDDCGFLHFHDASYDEVTWECKRCQYRWSAEVDCAPPCACGWKRGDSDWHDPCTPLEDPDDAEPAPPPPVPPSQ